MRILLIVQRLWQGGGTETHVLTLAKGLLQRGHVVSILTAGGPWVPRATAMGVRVHIHEGLIRRNGRDIQQCAAIFTLQHFHVVHAHDAVSFMMAKAASSLLKSGPRLVFTVHGPYVSQMAIRQSRFSAHRVIAVSPFIRQRLVRLGVPSQKILLVPNGIPTDFYRPLTPQKTQMSARTPPFVIGYAGRFTFDKVVLSKRISEILRRFASSRPATNVLIAGRNSRLQVASGTRFQVLGHVNRMDQFYHSCNVVICTGRTAAECLACGVPVIAIGKGGYHGLVTGTNVNRMLATNFGDHALNPQSWADARLLQDLTRVLGNEAFVRKGTQAARAQVIDRLSAPNMVRSVEQAYGVTK